MDTFQRLISAAVLALAGTAAHAGYAQAKPPPGFQPMPSAGPVTGWGYAKGANESFVNGTVRTTTSLNVGGRTITMPAAMRFAANAPRFAAAALYANPYLRFGLAAATWLGIAKVIWDEASQTWKSSDATLSQQSDGYTYWFSTYGPYSNGQQACDQIKSLQGGAGGSSYAYSNGICTRTTPNGYKTEYTIQQQTSSCPAGYYITSSGCTPDSPSKPLTKEEYERKLAPEVWTPGLPSIMPSEFPNELPQGVPLPVEIPVINPAPGPLPATPPAPRPYFEPSGDPVANPNYNPNAQPSPTNQPYIIPGTRIVPSPTPSEPWRVDVQPVQRPTESDVPKTADELNPQPDPNTNPDQQPKDQPKPEEQQQLCEKFPDILACQKLDTPEAQDLAREEVQISISPLGGWGAEDAACPAPKTAMVMGREVSLSWQPVCDFATGLRPLVIALAWLSAATMLIVVARRGN